MKRPTPDSLPQPRLRDIVRLYNAPPATPGTGDTVPTYGDFAVLTMYAGNDLTAEADVEVVMYGVFDLARDECVAVRLADDQARLIARALDSRRRYHGVTS